VNLELSYRFGSPVPGPASRLRKRTRRQAPIRTHGSPSQTVRRRKGAVLDRRVVGEAACEGPLALQSIAPSAHLAIGPVVCIHHALGRPEPWKPAGHSHCNGIPTPYLGRRHESCQGEALAQQTSRCRRLRELRNALIEIPTLHALDPLIAARRQASARCPGARAHGIAGPRVRRPPNDCRHTRRPARPRDLAAAGDRVTESRWRSRRRWSCRWRRTGSPRPRAPAPRPATGAPAPSPKRRRIRPAGRSTPPFRPA